MIRRLIILLLIVGLFAQDNDASKIRFDPETGEKISGGMRFDPETGEAIIEKQFDPETGEQIAVAEEKQKMSFGDFCILPFADGTLTGINIKNGSLEWQIETGKPITGFWRVGKGFITQDVKKMLRYYQ